MMTRARTAALIGILGILALLAPVPAEAAVLDRVGLWVSYWDQSLGGEGRIDGAAAGTTFTLKDTVGLDGEKGIAEVGAWFHPFGRHRFRVSGFQGSFDGAAVLTAPLQAGDQLLSPGTAVASSLDLDLYKAHYNYALINTEAVNFGILVGLDYVDARGALGWAGGIESASAKAPIPVIGANVQISPPLMGFFRVYGEASFADWKIGDVRADLRDYGVRAELYFAHFFGIGAGWRRLELEASEDGEGRLEMDTDGYQLYLLLRF
jgi:hypothetical protein